MKTVTVEEVKLVVEERLEYCYLGKNLRRERGERRERWKT